MLTTPGSSSIPSPAFWATGATPTPWATTPASCSARRAWTASSPGWLFTIGFYGDMILLLGDVIGVTFHACSRYIQGELGFYGSYTFSFGLALAL